MDEKDLVRMIKNSFAAKKSRAEILAGFQKRGYKLAYAEELIKKANRPKQFIKIFIACFIVLFGIGSLFYANSYPNVKANLSNPLSGFIISNNSASTITHNSTGLTQRQVKVHKTTYDKIKITPKFISYLLNEIGVWRLHKNPLTLEDPIINFDIDNETFHSEIGNKISTKVGLSDDADLEFSIGKKDLIDALMSNNPETVFKNSIADGRIKVKTMTTKTELFSKGYFNLYKNFE